jgi:hypothetical protein
VNDPCGDHRAAQENSIEAAVVRICEAPDAASAFHKRLQINVEIRDCKKSRSEIGKLGGGDARRTW